MSHSNDSHRTPAAPDASTRAIVDPIVSLLPAATEIVCALGLRTRLAGISHECDHPEDVRGLPTLTEARVDGAGTSAAIDREVRQILEAQGPLYRVREDVLARIAPTLIVTQDQCAVCALPREDLEAACENVGLRGARIVSLRAAGLYDLPRDFRRVAEAAEVPEAGDVLATRFVRGLAALKAKVGDRPRPRVALVEWLDPPMIAGGWMPELARVAGGEPLIVDSERSFETRTWAELADAAPEVTVLLPCGFDVARTRAELASDVRLAEAVRALPSTAKGRTFIVDGHALFNRPGPRLVESAELLARLLHPEPFLASGVPDARPAAAWS